MNLPIEGYQRRIDSREAADTGLLIWRENFVYFILFFAVPFWVCAFLLRLLPGKMQYFSYLILWWLKPFFDRIILHIISIRFFESGANLKRIRHGLAKNIFRGLAGDLLWRRFSPLRSAMMPVRVLELAGKSKKTDRLAAKRADTRRAALERKNNLKEGGINYCILLSLWGIAIEITLLIGEILFFTVMAEMFMNDFYSLLQLIEDSSASVEIYIFAAWCFNYMLVETIYVCMGFSVYINSRIEVEGWDLEIKFRSFAEKYGNQIKIGVLMFFLCTAFVFFPQKASAQDRQFFETDENVPLEELYDILKSPDFGGEKDSWGIRLKKPLERQNIRDFNALREISANVLRIFLIIVISALVVILFIFARKMIDKKIPAKKKSLTTALHGIQSENPQQLLEKSLEFYRQRELRLAWGYCTAAIILSWQFYRSIIFPPNATENDCAVMVSETLSVNSDKTHADEVKNFTGLIKYWVNFAYAGKLPPPESFDEAVSFCKLLRPLNERGI